MRTSTRARLRAVALSVITSSALAAALIAAPSASANGAAAVATSRVSSVRSARPDTASASVVTLLTGDRVLLRHDASGRATASLTPRSPHYGHQVEFMNTGSHTWVVPKLPLSERRRFDSSVFDVAALEHAGRVPLTVTFAKGAAPRSLPGLQVRTSSARSVGGRTTVSASYDAHRPLPASLTRSLRSVERISAPGISTVDAAPGYELHTLTINATDAKDRPLDGAEVFVINMDDSSLLGAFGGIFDGQWKLSVPSGHYAVLTDNFRRVVLDQVEVGDSDATTSLSLASATVQPSSVYPHHQSLGGEVDVIGNALNGGGFDFGYGGSARFPRFNPVAHMAAGSLFTEVSNQWSKPHYEPYEFTPTRVVTHPIKSVATAKEVRTGIPKKLHFRYRPADFASVTIHHDDTGARTDADDAGRRSPRRTCSSSSTSTRRSGRA